MNFNLIIIIQISSSMIGSLQKLIKVSTLEFDTTKKKDESITIDSLKSEKLGDTNKVASLGGAA